MATTFFDTLCPSVGAAWAATVGKWAELVQDPTNTLIKGLDNRLGLKGMYIRQEKGGDFFYWYYLCGDIDATAVKVPMAYVLGSPGFTAVPPILMDVYGAVNTKTSWENILYLLKSQIVENFCGATVEVAPIWDHTYADLPGVHNWTVPYQWRAAKQVGTGSLELTTKTAAVTALWLNNAPTTDGAQQGTPAIVGGGGGGSIDTTEIVEALQDIALRDVDYTTNNGNSIFSMRGRVRTGL